jgi:hypothetical protein
MGDTETESAQDQLEGGAFDFNSGNSIRNKALRRAQVRKDRRQKNKVFVVVSLSPKMYVYLSVVIITNFK